MSGQEEYSVSCPRCQSTIVERKFYDWNHPQWGEPDRLKCYDCGHRWTEPALKEQR